MALFTDYTQGPGASAAAVANKTALSDLTLSQSARMITRIWVTVAQVGTFAQHKPCLGYVIVESEDCDIEPMHIPIEPQGGYITLGGGWTKESTKWVVNVPCPGGTTLSFNVVADAAPNAAPEVTVTVEYSDGASPFPGGPFHMKCGEPAVSTSTSDNGRTSNTDIEIKASHLHMVFGYVVATTLVADSSPVANMEVSSDDFAAAGPHKFGVNPQVGGDANMGTAGVELTKIEQDIAFKYPRQKQTLSCDVLMRDAVSTAPVSNWGVVVS